MTVATLEGGWLNDVQANGTLKQLGNVLQAVGELLQGMWIEVLEWGMQSLSLQLNID